MKNPSFIFYPTSGDTSDLYIQKPDDGSGYPESFTYARSTVANRLNKYGLFEEVAINVPRIDYDDWRKEYYRNLVRSPYIITDWWNAVNSSKSHKPDIENPIDEHGSILFTATSTVQPRVEDRHLSLPASDTIYTLSTYIKDVDANWVTLNHFDGTTSCRISIEIATGKTANNLNVLKNTWKSVGGGWYRISITCSVGTGGSYSYFRIGASSESDWSVAEGSSVQFYFAGAQIEVSNKLSDYQYRNSATDYFYPNIVSKNPSLLLEPTSTNLIGYSNDFSHAQWAKVNVTATASIYTSPTGDKTASKIVEVNGTNVIHQVNRTVTSGITGGNTYTWSVFIKRISTNRRYFVLRTRGNVVANDTQIEFDLTPVHTLEH
jgi:hypothetical protein